MIKKSKERQVVILKIIGLSVLIGLLFGFVFGMSINKDIKRTSVCHDMFKFNETLEMIKEGKLYGKVLSLAAIPNLLVFFVFIKKKQDNRAKGVLLTTILIALTTLVLKFF